MEETVSMEMNVTVKLIRAGEVVQEETNHNITCNAGIAQIAAMIAGKTTPTVFTYVALGTGSTVPAATLTALVNEALRQQGSVTMTNTNTPGGVNDTMILTTGFVITGTISVSECGLFDSGGAGSGNMLGYSTIAVIAAIIGDQITITWNEIV